MNDYEQQCRAIAELSTLIQAGDMLTLQSGSRYVAGGAPQNRDTQGFLPAWLVSVNIGGCWTPVNLYTIVRVERGGRVTWTVSGERVPVQQALFDMEAMS
jgi:hypothetical protein